MAGEAAPAPKQDEYQPHPVNDQLPNISYCITSPPPWSEAILLGFQHYLVMLGTTVLIPASLVPKIGGGHYFIGFIFVPHMMRYDKHVFDRFAVIFSVVIVWIYAHLLTVGGAYKNTPLTTQTSCRTDRTRIISGSPWVVTRA